jgi:hypothetical protein
MRTKGHGLLHAGRMSGAESSDRVPVRTSRRPLRLLGAVVGVGAVVLASFVAHFVVWAVDTLDCSGFQDTPPPPPADASPQAALCGDDPSLAGQVVWYGGFALSAVVTVVLVVLVWRRWSWRVGTPALALLVVLPLLTSWLLDLPSDECTAQARATHPAWQCERRDP